MVKRGFIMAKKTITKQTATKQTKDTDAVKSGDKVSVDYTGKLNDGTVFDSSEGRMPLTFNAGKGEVIEGFDKAIIGMKKDESKTFTIPSENAYGPVRKELVIGVPRSKLPAQPDPKEGMQLVLRDPQGRNIPATITKVEKEIVTVNLNHPLAGKDLTFQIKVVGINDEERSSEKDCECGDKCNSDCDCGCEH